MTKQRGCGTTGTSGSAASEFERAAAPSRVGQLPGRPALEEEQGRDPSPRNSQFRKFC